MVLTFTDFPKKINTDICEYMPPEYSGGMVEPIYHPVVVNPKSVGNFIKQKQLVMACMSIHGNVIWVTAPHKSHSTIRIREFWINKQKYFVPCCYSKTQSWSETVPWQTLAEMDVKYTGRYLVFVPHNFQGNTVDNTKCTFIPALQAYMLIN